MGLTQAQVAEELGITQTAYALWERRSVALKPKQIAKVAKILNVSIEQLFGTTAKRSRGGSAGKLQRLLEEASSLPRRQQHKILEFVEPFIRQHLNGS